MAVALDHAAWSGEVLLRLEAVGLAVLTVALAGPVPTALARARWTRRSPRAALFLWQAVGLGGGLGILTAGLTLAASDRGDHWLSGLAAVPAHWDRLGALGWFGVALTACVGGWLIIAAVASSARVAVARRAQRRRLDLIADARLVGPADAAGGGTVGVRLVDHPSAFAYCLPGLRPQLVLSRGTLRSLSGPELAAVLAHEQAHARGHHDLVTQPFLAWAQTFPFLRPAIDAVDAVSLLVELLADDAALRQCERRDLHDALACLGGDAGTVVDRGGDDAAHGPLAVRLARLSGDPRPLARWLTGLIYVAAVALVVVPPLLLVLS